MTDKTERLGQEQREATHSRLQAEVSGRSRAHDYLESHRWVGECHRIERTPDIERFYVGTFLQNGQANPFAYDAITVEEVHIEWHKPYEIHPDIEPRHWLVRKLLPVPREYPYLHYLIRVDSDA